MSATDNLATYPSLRGRAVLISGGASGIGRSLVESFVRQGSRVAFLDINAEAGRQVEEGLGATFIECDLCDIPAVRSAAAAAKEAIGPVQVLVNNAAHDERHAWESVTEEFWDNRIAVNLRHAFFLTQAVAPDMVAAKAGSIINFGSTSWMLAQGGMPAYTASKAGVHGMTRAFARDLGKSNIRVNTMVPGWVMTERQREKWVTPEGLADMEKAMCLAGEVMPIDIANMVLWLAADDSRMCSGQNLIVDGGWI